MSDDNDNGRSSAPGGRAPLTLKPRGAGSVSAGTVKQSFSHGRSKTVVVETKRARTHVPGGGNLAAPSSAEKRVVDTRPAPGQGPRPARSADGGLSSEELQARQRAIELAREHTERTAAEARGRAEAEAAAARAATQAAAPAP
ncbi:MAG: IF-2-associated domain-containing protein, partial [Phenylobacterium sp.]|uniref:IF-2-associated domain-containing protein n=1 Tax=Phenylobacterium sp. TaxID=1871053 RepID=UPI0027336D30